MANLLTGLRILCAVALIFCAPFSPEFYILYLTAGFTDMLDGPIARKTNSASEFGSKFDSFADFIFVIVCLIKLLPILQLNVWIYIATIVIACLKLLNMLFSFIKFKELIPIHSKLNKLTGVLLFLFPLTFGFIDINYAAIIVVVISLIAAINESVFIARKQNKNNNLFCI